MRDVRSGLSYRLMAPVQYVQTSSSLLDHGRTAQ
jgi:hypothetical protein